MAKERLLAALAGATIIIAAGVISILLLPEGHNRGYVLIPANDLSRFDLPVQEGLNASILASVHLGGSYLVNHLRKDGSFDYLYDASKGKVLGGYNILRHAGSSYSLALAFKYTRDPDLYNGTVRSLNHLLSKYLVLDRIEGKRAAYIESGGVAKLGGAALALMCIVEVERMDPLVDYEDEMDLLGRFILLMQRSDGSLQCYYRANEDEHSDYYPGEALLAISKMYDLTRDESYLDALGRGLKYYNDFFSDKYTAYSPWAGEAILHYLRFTGNDTVADKCLRMADSCMAGQITSDPDVKFIGAFSRTPTASTASRLEAVFDAYAISLLRNDTANIHRYGSSMALGATFLLSLQIDGDEALGLPSPERAQGGFPNKYDDLTIRIDQNQHAIVVLVKAMVYGSGATNV